MPIVDQITQEMKAAMKAREKARLGALRGIRAAFIEAMKEDGSDSLADDKAITILRRLSKQRRESAEAYEAGGRDDLAEVEQIERAVVEEFLPSLADEATTETWVRAAIAEIGATSPRELGRIMGAVMKAHKGEADGNLTRQVALRLLQD